MSDYSYETFRAAHRCRCCGRWSPVLNLAMEHEKRCAEEHGVLLEPLAVWLKNS